MHRKSIFIIFFIALCLRIIFIVSYQNGYTLQNKTLSTDAGLYVSIANNLLSGQGYSLDGTNPTTERDPLYPLFIALIFFLAKGNYFSVRMIQCILGALNCVLIYLIGKEMFSRNAGIIAAVIAAFYYPFIQMSAYLVTETLSILLLLLSFWRLIKTDKENSIRKLLITGILLGLAGLTRFTYFGFYPLIMLILVIISPSKLQGLRKGIIIAVGIVIAFMPWVTRNYLQFNKFIPTSTRTGLILYQGNNTMAKGDSGGWWPINREYIYPEAVSKLTEIERHTYLGKKAREFIKNNPDKVFHLFFMKIANMWRPYYRDTSTISKLVMVFSYIPVMILGIFGIFLSHKNWRKSIFLIVFILYYVLVHGILVATIRYRWSTMPFFFIFSAYSLNYLREKFHGQVNNKPMSFQSSDFKFEGRNEEAGKCLV